jgi:hypothetical protein
LRATCRLTERRLRATLRRALRAGFFLAAM